MAPEWLAIGAASIFGSSVVMSRMAMQYLKPTTGAWFTMTVTFFFFLVLAPFFISWQDFLSPWVFWFGVVGFFQPFLSLTTSFQGTHYLGPTVSATVASISPLFSVVGAALLIGEHLTFPIIIGTFGIVLGVVALSWREDVLQKNIFRAALLLPLATAVMRGGASLANKYGLEMLPNPVLVGVVSYGVSFLAGMTLFGLRGGFRGQGFSVGGAKWVLAAGLANGAAIWMVLEALKTGEVMVVVPTVGAFPLFTLVISYLFLRQENLTWKTLAGVCFIIPSVALITLSR